MDGYDNSCTVDSYCYTIPCSRLAQIYIASSCSSPPQVHQIIRMKMEHLLHLHCISERSFFSSCYLDSNREAIYVG